MECLDNRIAKLEQQLARARQKNRLYRARIRELNRQQHTDGLTACLSKQGVELFGSKMVAHAARNGELVCVLFIDVDGFKQLNDTHGHAAGDCILEHLGSQMRQEDLCGRLQGDEFVAVLRGGLVSATMFVSRLHHAVSETNSYSTSCGFSSVSLSIGCVVLDGLCAHQYWAGSEEAKLHAIGSGTIEPQFSHMLALADTCVQVSKRMRQTGR